ncbi:hypothetical protein [Massilia sp. CCM 8734]|uniref:hypothetical protein n=1 Tax=Massilia sp. CCM 8734 TaxID=2609283 RepID=UPI0014214D4D|nr:hypothetical protein [Massilia sp. CCM 8734]NIA00352.1 hypothetical protein [Massilia sp. CCM 8734]
MTLSEFRLVVAGAGHVERGLSLECRPTIGMIANIEERGYFCRMIFWFDFRASKNLVRGVCLCIRAAGDACQRICHNPFRKHY